MPRKYFLKHPLNFYRSSLEISGIYTNWLIGNPAFYACAACLDDRLPVPSTPLVSPYYFLELIHPVGSFGDQSPDFYIALSCMLFCIHVFVSALKGITASKRWCALALPASFTQSKLGHIRAVLYSTALLYSQRRDPLVILRAWLWVLCAPTPELIGRHSMPMLLIGGSFSWFSL